VEGEGEEKVFWFCGLKSWDEGKGICGEVYIGGEAVRDWDANVTSPWECALNLEEGCLAVGFC
jgi:hypothetical protein